MRYILGGSIAIEVVAQFVDLYFDGTTFKGCQLVFGDNNPSLHRSIVPYTEACRTYGSVSLSIQGLSGAKVYHIVTLIRL